MGGLPLLEVSGSAGLAGQVHRASDLAEAAAAGGIDRWLPVAAPLRPLLPGGALRRGTTVAVNSGNSSLVLALLAPVTAAGGWAAVVGMPTLSPLAAAQAGAALERLAWVPHPGSEWSAALAALLDGFDLVVAAPRGRLTNGWPVDCRPGPVSGAPFSSPWASGRGRTHVDRWTRSVGGPGLGRAAALPRIDGHRARPRAAAGRDRSRSGSPTRPAGSPPRRSRTAPRPRWRAGPRSKWSKAGRHDLGSGADGGGLVPGLAGGRRPGRVDGDADGPGGGGVRQPGRSPARRRPGPRGSGAGCAGGRRRAAARGSVVVDARPGPGRAGVRAGGRGGRGARAGGGGGPARGCARSPPGARRGYFGGEARGRRAAGRARRPARARCEAQVGVADGHVRRRAGRAAPGGIVPRRASRRRSCAGTACATLDRPGAGRPAAPARHPHPRGLRRAAGAATCWPGSGSTRRCAHRLAARADDRPLAARRPPPDLAVHGRARPAGRAGRRGRVRRPGAGRAAARAAGRRTGWPAPGSAIEAARPSTARSCTGCGATTGVLDAGGDRRPGALAARRLAVRRPGRRVADLRRRHAGCGWSPTGRARRRSAQQPGSGARPARPTASGPGAGPGAGPARAGGGAHRRARRAAGARPTRSGWCRGATSAVAATAPAAPWPGRLPAPVAGHRVPEPLPATVARRRRGAGAGQRRGSRSAARPARLAVGRDAARGGHRLGRAVAGGRALVGAGRGPSAWPGSSSASPTAGRCCWSRRWPVAGGGALRLDRMSPPPSRRRRR